MYLIEFESGREHEVVEWLILNVGYKFKFDYDTLRKKTYLNETMLPWAHGNGWRLYLLPERSPRYDNVVEFDNPINAELFILKFK